MLNEIIYFFKKKKLLLAPNFCMLVYVNHFLSCLCVSGIVKGAPTEVGQPSDGRASLLESIRNAGGVGKANLRNVKERKMEKKKQKEQEQGQTPAVFTLYWKHTVKQGQLEGVNIS